MGVVGERKEDTQVLRVQLAFFFFSSETVFIVRLSRLTLKETASIEERMKDGRRDETRRVSTSLSLSSVRSFLPFLHLTHSQTFSSSSSSSSSSYNTQHQLHPIHLPLPTKHPTDLALCVVKPEFQILPVVFDRRNLNDDPSALSPSLCFSL